MPLNLRPKGKENVRIHSRDQNVDAVAEEVVEAVEDEVVSVETVATEMAIVKTEEIEDAAEDAVSEVVVDVAEVVEDLVVALVTTPTMIKMRTVADLVVVSVVMQVVTTLIVDLVAALDEMMISLVAEAGAEVVEDLPKREEITTPHLPLKILVGLVSQTLADSEVDSEVDLVVVLVGQKVMMETDQLVAGDSEVVDVVAGDSEAVAGDPVSLTDVAAMIRVL